MAFIYYVEVGSFSDHFLKSFYQKWVLNFVKHFFCIYWDYHIFIFQLVNMLCYIDWFVYVEESLHPWNKPHLVMVYDPFNMLLGSVGKNFVEDFCICVHQWYWPVLFFFCDVFVWFWYQGDASLGAWVWKCSFMRFFPVFFFLMELLFLVPKVMKNKKPCFGDQAYRILFLSARI